jgi:hypothetical protein
MRIARRATHHPYNCGAASSFLRKPLKYLCFCGFERRLADIVAALPVGFERSRLTLHRLNARIESYPCRPKVAHRPALVVFSSCGLSDMGSFTSSNSAAFPPESQGIPL